MPALRQELAEQQARGTRADDGDLGSWGKDHQHHVRLPEIGRDGPAPRGRQGRHRRARRAHFCRWARSIRVIRLLEIARMRENVMSRRPAMGSVTRRTFGVAAAGALAACSLPRWANAKTAKLKVGVLLPRSGLQALIGQSCQRGADVAPEVLRKRLGVEIEIMNADTESNVDTARSRAERLIEQGAHVLVGAFDSGHTAAIAQVAEQHGVPHIVNIAAAPQITEQGYKFVFRNFPTGARDGAQRAGAARRHLPRGQGRSRRRRCSCTSTTRSVRRWPRASRRCCPRFRCPSSCSTPSRTIRRPRT